MKLGNILLFLSTAILISCGGGGSGGDDGPDPEPMATPPSAASLVFPDDDEECNEGVIVSDTQSTVTFQWNASENTDTYEVNLRNLNTNNTTRTNATTNEAPITISRGTPYEWFVVSKANGVAATASSPTWRFYNQGLGIENYAPFPAEVVSPARGITLENAGDITLEWTASDVDSDIVSYEILFGTDTTPVTSIGTTAELSMNVTIDAGQVYYWRVLTTDSQNNTSQSEIFEFNVR